MTDIFLLIFYLFYYLFLMAYSAYAYIGVSLGGQRMARKVGMSNPWMFWIPCANVYALGNLADTQASLCEGKSTTYRKKMLAWTIVVACASVLTVVAMIPMMFVVISNEMMDQNGIVRVPEAFTDEMAGPALFFLLALLVFFVLYIIYMVIYFKVLYRIYKLYAPDGAAGLLVLSVLVNIAIPAVFLALSKREPVLPAPAPEGDAFDGGEAGTYSL